MAASAAPASLHMGCGGGGLESMAGGLLAARSGAIGHNMSIAGCLRSFQKVGTRGPKSDALLGQVGFRAGDNLCLSTRRYPERR